MAFLNPWLLLMLPAAILPLILHLWMSRRIRVVELSTFRFLFDSYVHQRRRLKFLEALVAALRTLFLLLLILLVARPVVKHWGALFSGAAGRDIIVLVDCSASMSAHADGVSSLDRAKTAAREVVERMGSGDRLTLIRAAGGPEVLFNRFGVDAENLTGYLDALEAGPSQAGLFKSLGLVSSLGEGDGRKAVVFVLTDCQAGEWQEVREQDAEQVLPENTQLVVVDVGPGEAVPNTAVVGTAPRNAQPVVGLPVILRPMVSNHSPELVENLPLSVFVEDKEIARMLLTLKPGQTVVRDVVYVPSDDGALQGRFEVPLDRFPDDDTFLFTLSVRPRLNILLIRPNPGNPRDPAKNEGLYIRTALDASLPDSAELAEMVPEEGFMRSLNAQELSEGELNADRLREVDLVILANAGRFNGGQFGLLRDFVFRGGGLLVFPGKNVKADTYNTQFFSVAGRPNAQLTPLRLGEVKGDPAKPETFDRLARIGFDHPVMSAFRDSDAQFFSTASVFRRFTTELAADEDNASRVLAEFSDGTPAMLESRFGDGRAVIAAFPANTQWTNLPMKPEFVPLVLRLVNHLSQNPDLSGPSVVTAGAVAEIVAGPSWAPAEGKVIDAAGMESPLDLQWSGTRLIGTFENTRRKGYYTAEVRGGDDPSLRRTGYARFAVNLAPEESDFALVGQNQLREWLKKDQMTVVDASAQIQHLQGTLGDEREVWRPLIYVTFLVIGVEFLLSTSAWRRRSAEERLSLMEQARRASPTTWVRDMTGGNDPTE